MKAKKNSLTHDQAVQLYEDLQRNMARIVAKTGGTPHPSLKVQPRRAEPVRPQNPSVLADSMTSTGQRSSAGSSLAISLVMLFAVSKVVISGLEATGFASASPVEASIAKTGGQNIALAPVPTGQQYSKEEIALLTTLDQRRAELEDRRKRLDDREAQLDNRDREMVARTSQLKEMTDALKQDREHGEKKKNMQLDQLANVYGSMDPKEAAALIEQLDVAIGLSLLQRMPEKRIGQILAMMSPARALTLTKMLSGKVE